MPLVAAFALPHTPQLLVRPPTEDRQLVLRVHAAYAEGAKNPRVMALAVHPYISGVPHRIKYFEAVYDYMREKPDVWFTTGEEIHDWYRRGRK